MLETTKEARTKAFELRKAKRFAEALVVLRGVWAEETDPVGKALLKLDAAFAYSGLKYYPKAEQLLQGLDRVPGLGEKPKASINILRAHIQAKKAVPRESKPAAKKYSAKEWARKSTRSARIRTISKKYVPAKFKPGTRPGWRRDVGY